MSGVAGVAVVLGLAAFAQETTGLLCGTDLPLAGEVTCDSVGIGDRADWYDARTDYLRARVEFERETALCDATGTIVGNQDPVTSAEYGACMLPAMKPYANALDDATGTGARLLDYLEHGTCRDAVDTWVSTLQGQRKIARHITSGEAEVVGGRLADSEERRMNRLDDREKATSDDVIEACGL